MNKEIFYAALLIVALSVIAFGQTPTMTPTNTMQQSVSLETILSEAEKQAQNYQLEFRNLLADETKTFETYNKNGEVKDKDVVESTFLVYQSSRNEKVSSELRNVVRVNGNAVPDSQKRSEQLLGELQKQTTLEKELQKLQSEGARYDKTLEINGMTLSEAVVLSNNLRPFFDFQLQGRENFKSREVYVVNYRQTRKSPYVSLNTKDARPGELSLNFDLSLPGSLKKADAFLRGKLWIDANTYQIWREERELTVQDPNPVVLLTTVLEYQMSDYGILVPKQISLETNTVKKQSNQYTAVKDMRVNFDYSKFRKTETDVKIIDDDQ
jgi:hypothetical protein